MKRHGFRPADEWVVTLRLPSAAERRSDGGVWCHIIHAPAPFQAWRGRWCWLCLMVEYGDLVDVTFSPLTWRARGLGYQLGTSTLIDGWRSVSALEAYAHQLDSYQFVALKNPQVHQENDRKLLVISRWPIMLGGPLCALVKFVEGGNDEFLTIRHYNPLSGQFDGQEVLCTYRKQQLPGCPVRYVSPLGIEASIFNENGFYIYGDFTSDYFQITAIQPKVLTEPSFIFGRATTVHSAHEFLHLMRSKQSRQGYAAEFTYLSEANKWGTTNKIGKRWLIFHSYVSHRVQMAKWLQFYTWLAPRTLSWIFWVNEIINSGHLGLGFAEIVTDPFTRLPKVEITYAQPMVPGMFPMPSGYYDWASFLGRIDLGFFFWSTVTDVFLDCPAFFETKNAVSCFESLCFRLEEKFYDFLTGYGEGLLDGTVLNNCSTAVAYALGNILNDQCENNSGDVARMAGALNHALFDKSMPRYWEAPHTEHRNRNIVDTWRISKTIRSPLPNVIQENMVSALIQEDFCLSSTVCHMNGQAGADFIYRGPLLHTREKTREDRWLVTLK